MLGAIVGDIIGSIYEWNNIKTTNFPLLSTKCHFTDDTVMTLAIAKWLMEDAEHSQQGLVKCMQDLGRKYSNAGYGGRFRKWLASENPKPYHSFGNGSAMRVSPVALYATTLDEALELAKLSAEVTHNHREGIYGAQATAACIFMHRDKQSKEVIKAFITDKFGYNLNRRLSDIRPDYHFDETCLGSVPIAILAFFEATSFEETIRLAISMGGDSDTLACIAGSIASAGKGKEYAIAPEIEEFCLEKLSPELREILVDFERFLKKCDDKKHFNKEYYEITLLTNLHRSNSSM